MPVVECVPNFSVGRDPDVIREIAGAMNRDGVRVVDVQSDPDHNRSVVTVIGGPDEVCESALAGVRRAADLIDMRTHRGGHPRIGAADVVPLVPIRGLEMEQCVELARGLGRRIGELGIPVFLYGEAATTEERRSLPQVRKGEFEGLVEKMTGPGGAPDFGPDRPHPSAGAVAVGARKPLIAFNVNLNTADLKVARVIARTVRESGGGLPHVRALGLYLEDRGLTQVSMNLTDYEAMPIGRVYDEVAARAREHGVTVADTELVGLVPQQAVLDLARHMLNLQQLGYEQVIESWLMEA